MNRSYTDWSKEDLVKHIRKLESGVITQNSQGAEKEFKHLVKGSRLEPKTKKLKPNPVTARHFDFHKYKTKYVAFKFAYLGWHYNGLVMQDMPTELPTVEEEIFKALLKTKLIEHPDTCRFSRCGRTDKGVSAMGQVMALNVRSSQLKDVTRESSSAPTELETEAEIGVAQAAAQAVASKAVKELPWLDQLNGCLPPSIRILAYDDTISPDFDARFSCVKRHYKYIFAPEVPGLSPLDINAMKEACTYLVGTHDFRNFCKLDASKQITNFTRTILRCEISPLTSGPPSTTLTAPASPPPSSSSSSSSRYVDSGSYVLDLEGTAFLWHQVRCITAILLLIGQGHEQPTLIRTLLDTASTPTKPVYEMADDWPLTLYDCEFKPRDVRWKYPVRPARLVSSTFATAHAARIKSTISSFFVDAACASLSRHTTEHNGLDDDIDGSGDIDGRGGSATREKTDSSKNFMDMAIQGINLGDGKVKVQSRYVPIMQRPRLEDVTISNAKWAAKKKAKGMAPGPGVQSTPLTAGSVKDEDVTME